MAYVAAQSKKEIESLEGSTVCIQKNSTSIAFLYIDLETQKEHVLRYDLQTTDKIYIVKRSQNIISYNNNNFITSVFESCNYGSANNITTSSDFVYTLSFLANVMGLLALAIYFTNPKYIFSFISNFLIFFPIFFYTFKIINLRMFFLYLILCVIILIILYFIMFKTKKEKV